MRRIHEDGEAGGPEWGGDARSMDGAGVDQDVALQSGSAPAKRMST